VGVADDGDGEGVGVAIGVADEAVTDGVIEGAAPLPVGEAAGAAPGDAEGMDPHPARTNARTMTPSLDAAR
jgi:hypothetical protein